jgi:hypothetical protein
MAVDFTFFLLKGKRILNKGQDLWFTGVKYQNLKEFTALMAEGFI